MRRMMGALALCLAWVVGGMGTARAAGDFFVKLDGLTGDSNRTGYVGWSELLDWSVGHGFAPSAGPAGARPLVITKSLDRSSTSLAAAAAAGTRFRNAVLDVVMPSGGVPVLRYRIILHDVAVRSYNIVGGPGSNFAATESVELGYSRIEWYQFSVGPTGALIQTQAKFDVARNVLYP